MPLFDSNKKNTRLLFIKTYLFFILNNRRLFRYIQSIQELSYILIFDSCRLLNQCSWNLKLYTLVSSVPLLYYKPSLILFLRFNPPGIIHSWDIRKIMQTKIKLSYYNIFYVKQCFQFYTIYEIHFIYIKKIDIFHCTNNIDSQNSI
jgi:hypothetical protein